MNTARNWCLTIACFVSINVMAEGINLGFVDMEHIFQGFFKTVKADFMLKEQTGIYKEYAVGLEKEIDRLQKEYGSLRDESQNIALSEEARGAKRDAAQNKFILLQEKKKELREYKEDKHKELRVQYQKQRATLVEEIANVVQELAKGEGYHVVLDSSGKTLNGIPAFVYYDPELDFTEKVLAVLNKGHEDELKELLKKSEALNNAAN